LLGIEPEGPDEEYGWIEPNREDSIDKGTNLWRVQRFWEKPSQALARDLMTRGCLWNSFVMVGAVSAFLKMMSRTTRELYSKFTAVKSRLSTGDEKKVMESVYSKLRDSNFSREVLQARPADLAVIPVRGSKWSDLGSPRRVFSTLAEFNQVSLIKYESIEPMKKSPEKHYGRARVRSSQVV
jgi:mannose-1-phosphate guanylyltransferase